MLFPRTSTLALLLALPLAFTACKKDDDDAPPPAPNQEGEVITTVKYTLTPVGGGATVMAQYRDTDGDGGGAPVLTYGGAARLILDKSKTYTGEILLLDESKSPVDTISNEVLEEANEHLFIYKATPASLLTVTRTDRDTNMPPLELGLTTGVVPAAAAGTGTLQIILKHQPGVKNGTEAPGDTDIDVTFPVEVR